MMPESHQNVLWFITKFLNKIIQNKEINKMNEYNIATCIALTVCRPPFEKDNFLTETRNIIESFYYILCHFTEAFEEVDKRNATMTFPPYPAFHCPCPEISKLIDTVKSSIKSFESSSPSSSSSTTQLSPRILVSSQKRGEKIRINPPESQRQSTDETKEKKFDCKIK